MARSTGSGRGSTGRGSGARGARVLLVLAPPAPLLTPCPPGCAQACSVRCPHCSVLSPERGAKPVTSFVKNLSALSDWYSVYTSAIAFTVRAPRAVGGAPPGLRATGPPRPHGFPRDTRPLASVWKVAAVSLPSHRVAAGSRESVGGAGGRPVSTQPHGSPLSMPLSPPWTSQGEDGGEARLPRGALGSSRWVSSGGSWQTPSGLRPS